MVKKRGSFFLVTRFWWWFDGKCFLIHGYSWQKSKWQEILQFFQFQLHHTWNGAIGFPLCLTSRLLIKSPSWSLPQRTETFGTWAFMENDCYRCYISSIPPPWKLLSLKSYRLKATAASLPPLSFQPDGAAWGAIKFALAGFMGRFAAGGYLFVPFISMGHSKVHTKLRLLSHTKHDNTYWSKIKAQGGLTNVLAV